MTEPFVVEVWGKPAGIVVKEGNAFRFYAMAHPFFELDGAQFTDRGPRRDPDLDRGRRRSHQRLPNMCEECRLRSAAPASASRMVVPV